MGNAAEPSHATDDELTYGTYLALDELLALQRCRSIDPVTGEPEHDELLFIVIHQIYELWFKQMLHELDRAAEHLDRDVPERAAHQLRRVREILKTLVAQIDVLETMTPLEFAGFRGFLASASGFQSAQFRALEFLLGAKDARHLDRFTRNPREHDDLRRRLAAPTLWDAFVGLVARRGFDVPGPVLERDVREPVASSPELQVTLTTVYRTDPGLAALCEAMIDLDEGLQEWRYRHVMMVRRTIGTKPGTGGSDGAAYLAGTLFRPVFVDLWEIRTRF